MKKKNRVKGCATLCPGGFLHLASYWPVDKGYFGMWGRGESKRNVESKRLPLKEGAHGTRPCKKTCCFTSQLEPMRCFFASRNRKPDVGRLAPEMRTSFEFLIGEPILAGRIRGVESRWWWWWWVHRSLLAVTCRAASLLSRKLVTNYSGFVYRPRVVFN